MPAERFNTFIDWPSKEVASFPILTATFLVKGSLFCRSRLTGNPPEINGIFPKGDIYNIQEELLHKMCFSFKFSTS